MTTMSQLTINVHPSDDSPEGDSLEAVKSAVAEFFRTSGTEVLLQSGMLSIDWYDDRPVSPGVAVIARFATLDAFNALAALQVALRKKRFSVFVSLG